MLLVLLFLTGPLQYLPRSVLAAIVFTIAVGMVDVGGCAIFAVKARGSSNWRFLPQRQSSRSASSRAS